MGEGGPGGCGLDFRHLFAMRKAILGVTASESLSSEELQKGTLLKPGTRTLLKMKMNPGQYSEISSHLFSSFCSAVSVLSLGVRLKRSLIVNS